MAHADTRFILSAGSQDGSAEQDCSLMEVFAGATDEQVTAISTQLAAKITGQTIDLSGGTSASPSATGLAAKAILVTAGNTVNTN